MSGQAPEALLLDLDDTLYDEASYVKSGMSAVAEEIACRTKQPGAAVRAALLDLLEKTGRQKILDRALPYLGLEPTPPLVAELVALYRAHRPRLTLYPGVKDMLARLRERYRIAVVTDGLAEMQRAKVAALGLASAVDTVVYCWEAGSPKPAAEGYLAAAALLDTTPARSLVVGDNPDHDMLAAAAAGMLAVRVRTGRFREKPNPAGPDVCGDLAHVVELESWLAHWEHARPRHAHGGS